MGTATDYLTIEEVAAELGVTYHTIYRWVRKGAGRGMAPLPAVKARTPRHATELGLPDTRLHVSREALDAYLTELQS